MEEIYTKLNDDIAIASAPMNMKDSDIRKFYAGKTVLLSGCTGYLGTCVVEKLLRSCPEIKRIYVIIRPKKGLSCKDRVEIYFDHVLFGKVRQMFPNCKSKVVGISGDLLKAGLDLSPTDRQLLQQEVDIIIHNAAEVNFMARVGKCLTVNVLGAKEILDLAIGSSHLQCFVYVSTAFSHCYKKNIDEVYYPAPADLKMVQDFIQADTENEAGLNENYIKTLLGPWPNIYTYSKATAESIVLEYSKKVNFPCIVYRPSIITSTYHEPIARWCTNKNGPNPLAILGMMGYIHVMYTDGSTFDIVPADMTTNGLLAAIWYTVVKRGDVKKDYIYNFSTSVANPINLVEIEKHLSTDIISAPSINSVWYYSIFKTKSFFAYVCTVLLFAILPATLIDIVSICRWKKPMLLRKLLKVYQMDSILKHFYRCNRFINTTEMAKVWDAMTPIDQKTFPNDLRALDWADYFCGYCRGLRTYVLHESMDNIEAAKRKYQKLKIIHYVFIWSVLLLLLYFILRMMNDTFKFL